MDHDKSILILDFGSQYTQLIARKIRELGVYCEIHAYDMSKDEILAYNPLAIILSGGPQSVYKPDSYQIDPEIFALDLPILGICYGMQLMAQHYGGTVIQGESGEFGDTTIEIDARHPMLEDLQGKESVWMSHEDQITQAPPGFVSLAHSKHAPVAMFVEDQKRRYGVQFHPEVSHSPCGMMVIKHFVFEIAKAPQTWLFADIKKEMINNIQQELGKEAVLLALSGGVDSSVLAVLLHQAVGSQLHPVFVDNGLLREGEVEQVQESFKALGLKLDTIDAKDIFLDALEGISDPETKRKTIGRVFIEVFQDHAKKYPEVTFLAQGTIYPDIIESAASKTQKGHLIKSHHNVGGLPESMNLKLLEPLRDLFKDEVRNLVLGLACPKPWCIAILFQVQALQCALWVRLRASYTHTSTSR